MKLDLDLTNANVQGTRVVLPTANYNLCVAGVEVKENKAKTGGYLETTFKVVGGKFDGANVVDRFNIQNTNADAVEIGFGKIKTILTYGGAKNPNKLGDTKEMIGLKVSAYIEEVSHSFEAKDGKTVETTQNNIKGYNEFLVTTPESQETAAPTAAAPKAAIPAAATVVAAAAQTAAPAGAFPWQQ